MTVMIQEQVDAAYMGRVSSISVMINSIAMPIGIALFGPLADVVSIELLLLVSGALMMIFGLLYLVNRPMMNAGMPTAKPISQAK
jgi:DHA3 family macrolide efflux protein-like MFS transporter